MTDRWMLVCVLLVAAGIAVGWLLGHWRAYAECCDCCTCQTCTEEDEYGQAHVDLLGDHRAGSAEVGAHDPMSVLPRLPGQPPGDPAGNDTYPTLSRRHTVVLEPGPTIYPALAQLAGEVMDGPHGDSEPTTSTWLMERRLWMENRYPIPVEA